MRTGIGVVSSRVLFGAREWLLEQPPTLGDSDCEALRAGFLSQPVNTVTSLSFLGVGLWAATRVPALEQRERTPAALFAALVALNGVGSAAYHGPQFPGAQALHDLPAHGAALMSIAVPLWREVRGRRALPGWTAPKGYGLAAVAALAAASYLEGRSASRLCDPESWLQLHGLWHLSTAALMALWTTVLWPGPAEVEDRDRHG